MGYIVQEVKKLNFNKTLIEKQIRLNQKKLLEWKGLEKNPKLIYKLVSLYPMHTILLAQYLDQVQPNDKIRFPDGTQLSYNDIYLTNIRPRILVFVQDTCSASVIANHLKYITVLVLI